MAADNADPPRLEPHAMRNRLDAITIRGFKTIRQLDSFQPGSLAVLIGPNGAGKSNFVNFFRMTGWMIRDRDNLQTHVARRGGASKLLHDGPAVTQAIDAEFRIQRGEVERQYGFRLEYAASDAFVFAHERYRVVEPGGSPIHPWQQTGAGHRAPQLIERSFLDDDARFIRDFLRRTIVYHFHDTSSTAGMKQKSGVNDNAYLRGDGRNIASILYRIRREDPKSYLRIVDTIRLILPFFSDFELEPEHGHLLLAWRERNNDIVFDVSQASDGMLRVVALVTLLLQPEEHLPDVVVLDEPELGLHPYAITVIGGLIRAASTKVQVIVATQSTSLVDQFDPEHVVVVERKERESTFRRLGTESLQDWLEDYSLSELWEKNVIGGRP